MSLELIHRFAQTRTAGKRLTSDDSISLYSLIAVLRSLPWLSCQALILRRRRVGIVLEPLCLSLPIELELAVVMSRSDAVLSTVAVSERGPAGQSPR